MKRFSFVPSLLAIAILVASIPALAARWTVANSSCSAVNCKLLDTVASTAAAASRTVTIDVTGWSGVVFSINHVHSSGTAVTVTCTISNDMGTTYSSVASTSISAGAGTVSPYVDTWTTSASGNMPFPYDVHGQDRLSCVFAVTGGGAGDKITVIASAWR